MNCWEFQKCGLKGICGASTYKLLDGVHGGTNGGRACWALKATHCGESHLNLICKECAFYLSVLKDEKMEYALPEKILNPSWPFA